MEKVLCRETSYQMENEEIVQLNYQIVTNRCLEQTVYGIEIKKCCCSDSVRCYLGDIHTDKEKVLLFLEQLCDGKAEPEHLVELTENFLS